MKALNIKLATFSFAALLLASCSDSNSDGTTNVPIASMNSKIIGSDLMQNTNAQELASRVFNYKSKIATKSRTIDESNSSYFTNILSMPEAPASIPADAKNLKDYTGWDLPAGTYYVPAGETVECNHPYSGVTLYVAGTFIQNGMNADEKTNIYILKGGKWKTDNQELLNGNATVYNYGTLEATNNQFTIKGTYLTDSDLNFPGDKLNIEGSCYVGGNLTAKELTNSGMCLNVKGNCNLGNSKFILNGSTWNGPKGIMNVDGTFTCGSLELNSDAKLYSSCATKVAGTVNVNSGSELHISYLKAGDIIQSSGCKFILKDQSLIECNTYTDNNASDDWNINNNVSNAGSLIEGDNAVAVIKAKKFAFNTGAPTENGTMKFNCFMFRTPSATSKIVLDGKFYQQNLTTEIIPFFPGTQIYRIDQTDNISDVIINKTECNGQTGWKPGKDPDPEPNPNPTPTPKPSPIVPISVIEPDHTHDISATCVQPFEGKMYMSYHTRGDGHGSCLEVFDPVDANNEVKLLQYIYDSEGLLDWNHLMVYDANNTKQVYAVGSHYKKAGALGYIDITSSGLLNADPKTIVTEEGEKKEIKPLNILPLNAKEKGTDENCIVYDSNSNRFIVATTKGYTTYDPATLNEIETVEKPGKAKHVAIGDGKVVTLVFTEQALYNPSKDPAEAAKEWIHAQIEVRDISASMKSTPDVTITTPAILPHYGKNTIAVKNGKIYACLGAAGLYCYDLNTGAELGHYQMPNPIIKDSKQGKNGSYKAYANGCFVGDDGKVYIAYGSYGVVVLKAGTLESGSPETIAHREEGKSANYITVYNGYIYVAYGQKRLQVYQLVEN